MPLIRKFVLPLEEELASKSQIKASASPPIPHLPYDICVGNPCLGYLAYCVHSAADFGGLAIVHGTTGSCALSCQRETPTPRLEPPSSVSPPELA